jgi:hypothetical protein
MNLASNLAHNLQDSFFREMNIKLVSAAVVAWAKGRLYRGIIPQGLKPTSILWRLRHD